MSSDRPVSVLSHLHSKNIFENRFRCIDLIHILYTSVIFFWIVLKAQLFFLFALFTQIWHISFHERYYHLAPMTPFLPQVVGCGMSEWTLFSPWRVLMERITVFTSLLCIIHISVPHTVSWTSCHLWSVVRLFLFFSFFQRPFSILFPNSGDLHSCFFSGLLYLGEICLLLCPVGKKKKKN